MGLDLSLLPFDYHSDSLSYSHTLLDCYRRSELFAEIQDLAAVDVPDGFMSYVSRDDKYEDSHYGVTEKTPYGERMNYVEVEALLGLSTHDGVIDNNKNRAVWAYLRELLPRTKIALFWN